MLTGLFKLHSLSSSSNNFLPQPSQHPHKFIVFHVLNILTIPVILNMDIFVNILTKLTLVSILVIFTMLIELNILTTSSSSPCSLLPPSRSILVIFIIAIELNILPILVILARFIAHHIRTILSILIIFIMCIRPRVFNNLSQAQLPIFLNLPMFIPLNTLAIINILSCSS
jgi:hypothetical protein